MQLLGLYPVWWWVSYGARVDLNGRVDRVIAWNNAPDRRVGMVIVISWVAALLHQAHVHLALHS